MITSPAPMRGSIIKATVIKTPESAVKAIVESPKVMVMSRTTNPTKRETKFIIPTRNLSSSAILLVSISSRFQGKNKVLAKRSIEKKSKNFLIVRPQTLIDYFL